MRFAGRAEIPPTGCCQPPYRTGTLGNAKGLPGKASRIFQQFLRGPRTRI